jgi:DNA-directed RNA polymerase specialized sigma24 family protein
MSSASVTAWIDQLRAGDRAAAEPLWRDYFQRLVGLARVKLRGRLPSAMAGPEDVALSAFKSFCRGAEQGRFPQLSDRYDLWRLLFVITERKAIDLVNHEKAEKRGGGKVRHEGSLGGESTAPFDKISSQRLTPEQAALVAEQFRLLLDALKDETLQAVAVAKMEGYTNKEIAKRINRSEPAVERKLNRIRKIWRKEAEQ